MERICKLTAFLLSLFLLASCATNGGVNDDTAYTFTDSAGHSVSVKKAPQCVAVLFSSFAEVWISAGGNVAITVGESVERGICDKDTVLVDNGAGKTIDTEALIAAAPDFVLVSTDIPAQREAAALLREAKIPVAEFRVESFSDYLVLLKICTQLTGHEELYETYGAAQKNKIDTLVAEQPLAGKCVLFVRAGTSASSVKAKSSEDHFAAAMLSELGALNIADKAPLLLDGLSMEVILVQNPDFIYFTAMGDEGASKAFVESLLQGEDWRALDAVRNGNYRFLPKELFHYKPNAKWAQAYADLIP